MHPLVSVITVCKNACEDLVLTRNSVFSQDYEHFEWVVVDGASKDGTVEKIQSYLDPRTVFRSEPDASIYDAMNKGLKLARGEWVWFLNAGDCFYNDGVMARLAEVGMEYSVCFSEAEVYDCNGLRLGLRSEVLPHQCPQSLNRDDFRFGMLVSHQAFVVRRGVALPYDLCYRFSSDLDWMLRILESRPRSVRMDTLVRVVREGETTRNWHRSQWERFQILVKHFGLFRTSLNHLWIVLRRIGHVALKLRSEPVRDSGSS